MVTGIASKELTASLLQKKQGKTHQPLRSYVLKESRLNNCKFLTAQF